MDDLSDIVGPELADLVNCTSVNPPRQSPPSSLVKAIFATGSGASQTNQQNGGSNMPASIIGNGISCNGMQNLSSANHSPDSGNSTSSSSSSTFMSPDISDLRSSDLLTNLSGIIDIDKMFADFQADQHDPVITLEYNYFYPIQYFLFFNNAYA